MVIRYPSPSGTSRERAARFAGEVLLALIDRPGPLALRLDLTALLDPGQAWIDECLNRRLVPYCRERGVPITIRVGTPFAEEQVARTLDPTVGKLVGVQRVERGPPPRRKGRSR